MKQTWDNYFREYYANNRERILENSREYRDKYNHSYYAKNRLKLLAKAKMKRLKAKLAKMEAKPQSKGRPEGPKALRCVKVKKTPIT